MYQDQHTVESMGTARLIARNAYAYENYLSSVFGRDWRLAGPAKIKGPARLRVKFAPEKVASGDGNGPFIVLWVEYNPAMGLYTVWGEYWGKEDATEPEYTSSPRTGFDDEMLGDPSRLFDWLDTSVTMGEGTESPDLEAVAEALGGMMTPAGEFVDADLQFDPDGAAYLWLEPEMRMPKDYFVSGTRFPGMTGPDELDYTAQGSVDQWFDSYVNPVQGMVQGTLDNLYGVGAFKAEVDYDGYVLVSALQPFPPQNFVSGSGGPFSKSDNLPKDSNLPSQYSDRMESKKALAEDDTADLFTQNVVNKLRTMKSRTGGKLMDVRVEPKRLRTISAELEKGKDAYRHLMDGADYEQFFSNPVADELSKALRNAFNSTFKVKVDGTRAYIELPRTMGEEKRRTSHADAILRMAGVGGHEKMADRKLSKKGEVAEAWYDSGTAIDVSDKPKKNKPPLRFSKVKTKDEMAKFDSLVAKLKAQKKAGAKIRDVEALAGWIGLRMAGKKGAAKKGAQAEESVESSDETPQSVYERMNSLLK